MKKIMFDTKYGLEQAVLAGTKTMTRRIIPTAETEGGLVPVSFWNGKWCGAHGKPLKRQPYKVGEVLAVAQSYKDCGYTPEDLITNRDGGYEYAGDLAGYTNKMFVSADWMNHIIHITNVRVERIQDISDSDCLDEGIVEKLVPEYRDGDKLPIAKRVFTFPGSDCRADTPRQAFAILIDKISGKGTWDKNPWTFAYEFELVK